jgi:glycerol kinase
MITGDDPMILSLDQGTTSCRAIIFDESGAVRAIAQKEFRQIFPKPGWVEHDAQEIWATQSGVAAEAMAHAGLKARDLTAVGITNQRETTVLWDRATGEPLANAIVWQDRRTAAHCDQLKAGGHAAFITERTGLVVDAYFSATKLRWLLDHVPGARARAEDGGLAFGTMDSWLAWKLTGGARHVTDATNASRTMLFNIRTGEWDADLLELFEIPRAVLPEVCASSGIIGECACVAPGVALAGMAGDQHAALFGQACMQPGMVKNTYGTGCFLLMNTGAAPVPSRNGLLTTLAWRRGKNTSYALEGSVFIGGAVVQWLRDGLGVIRSSAEIEALAASVPDAGGVTFVPAFAGLGAPHWDPRARGTIGGLTRGSTAGHIARAALESIAFQTADVLDAMRADSEIAVQELRADGGAARNDLLLQFQADLIGVPVIRSAISETTALGAAFLAGLATGVWQTESDLARQWRAERVFEPRISPALRAERVREWQAAVARVKSL